ncbi:MAG: electron transfer flavoprotein subunit beta/FixA family protein [Candidatus Gastranaerophilales bacterium]
MKIVVCIKQIPDTTDIKWTENNTIQREGVESIINPYDVYALETALEIKKQIANTEITVLTMGPAQATDMLKKALAIGCDNAILVSDRKFAGADTYATSKTLSNAIKKQVPDFDLIICGQFALDGDTAQTGPGIASKLEIVQATFIKQLTEINENFLIAKREIEEGIEITKIQLPALICVLQQEKEPTRALIDGIIKAENTEIVTLSANDIDVLDEEVGIKGSPTYVSRAFRPDKTRQTCQNLTSVDELFNKLNELGVNKAVDEVNEVKEVENE